ncbi:hypothetical protein [Palleronia sp. LCG004]|uniref:hypothetical protein n=1 Tax=Palleronia sp. LCG004 TaxID=3079304 RepID=UPI002943B98F|nr:hypothetical protein [Palleronia sp. LCG004]WOI57061.1 hypothetical protein RVY76_04535 [Palleronia sp. LCG004]
MKGRAIALAVLLLAGPSHAFVAQNGLRVEDRGPGEFHVPYSSLSGARAFWCAAGDYAIRVLHVHPATRIYRTSAPRRASGEGISFSLSSENATSPGLLRLSGSRGLTAGNARFQCELTRRRD